MSNRDYCDVLAIHLVPAATSKKEFEAKYGTFLDAVAKLPVVQRNVITLMMFIQNDAFNEPLAAMSLPLPQPAVVGFAKFKNVDSLKEVLRDPEYVSLVSAAKENGHLRGNESMSLFSADVVTKLDMNRKGDRQYAFGFLKIPKGVSAELFTQKFEALVDGILALPFHQTLHIADELQRLGLPAPQPLVGAIAEFAHVDHLLEIGRHNDFGQHIATNMTSMEFPLHHDSIIFTAEGITKLNRDD